MSYFQIPVSSSITTPVSIANGGTGAENTADALVNLTAAGSGANADITGLFSGDVNIGTNPFDLVAFYGVPSIPQVDPIIPPFGGDPTANEAAIVQIITLLERYGLVATL